MQKVRIISSPREGDPPAQQKLWIGMEISVAMYDSTDPMENVGEDMVWLDYEEVIAKIAVAGDAGYASFFRAMREHGARHAPGLLIHKKHCESIAG